MRAMIWMAGVVLCAMLSAPARSATVTWVLPGVVTAIDGPIAAAPFAVSVGTAFEFSIVFDADGVDANADVHEGTFSQALLSAAFGTAAGSILWPIEQGAELVIRNDLFRAAENRTVDEIAIAGQTVGGPGAPGISATALLQNATFGVTTPGPLTSDALPQQPDPRDWATRSFFFSYQPAGGSQLFELTGELGQPTPNVPLPAPLGLLAASLLLLLGIKFSRADPMRTSASFHRSFGDQNQ